MVPIRRLYVQTILLLIYVAKCELRIVGGEPTPIEYIPSLVQIWVNDAFVCGGSLVDVRYVLSAAHCCYGVTPDTMKVIANATHLADSSIKHDVGKLMIPNGYNSATYHLDVAMLKLVTPMTGVAIIPLHTGIIAAGIVVTVFGWGRTSEKGSLSNHLRSVDLETIDTTTCVSRYQNENLLVTNSMFCALSAGKDACAGDSGGAVVYNDQLCGIVSWGLGCARDNFPGVFTRISYVLPFIQNCLLI